MLLSSKLKNNETDRKDALILLIILFVGLVGRLISATKVFWFDEAWSWAIAKQSIPQLLAATAADNNPPLYYLLLHYWLKLGASEFLLRLPSIFFGLGAVYLVYKIAKNIFDRRVALFSALLFSLSPLQIYYASETRMYSLWTMLILFVFFYFLKLLENPRKKYFLLFTFCLLLSLYTHYFTILFALALDLFLFLKRKEYQKQLSRLIIAQAVIGLLFLPWQVYFLANPHPLPWGNSTIFALPATLLSFTLGGIGQVTLKAYFAGSVPFWIRSVFFTQAGWLFFLFIQGVGGQKSEKKKNGVLLLFLIIFFSLALAEIISFARPINSPRGFVAFSAFFYLLAASGLVKLPKQLKLLAGIFTITLLILTFVIQNFYPFFKPQTVRLAAQVLKKQPDKLTNIIHTDILTFYPFQYYLERERPKQFLVFSSGLSRKSTDIVGGSMIPLANFSTQGKPFWSATYNWDEKTWKFAHELEGLKKQFNCNVISQINDLEIKYCQPI